MRLQRIGKPGQAHFRLVLQEHTSRVKGGYIELLGSYDPHKKLLQAKADRIKYWLSQGVRLSPTLNNLLVGQKVIEGVKVPSWKPKRKKGEATPAA